MTDAYDTLREMLANVPDDAQVYVEELESIVEWPGITAGTFRQLLACFEGFEAMWEAREKAHDADVATLRAETLREARYEVEKVRQQITTRAAIEFPRPSAATKDAINALVSLTDGILTALDALAQPEGTA